MCSRKKKQVEIEAKPKKKILAGMFRPRWETIWKQVEDRLKESDQIAPFGWFQCNCKSLIKKDEVRDHWQNGHFDEPVYQEIEA